MRGSEDHRGGHIIQGNSAAGNPPVNYSRYFMYQDPTWFYTNPTTLLGDNGHGFNMEGASTLNEIYANDLFWAPYRLDRSEPAAVPNSAARSSFITAGRIRTSRRSIPSSTRASVACQGGRIQQRGFRPQSPNRAQSTRLRLKKTRNVRAAIHGTGHATLQRRTGAQHVRCAGCDRAMGRAMAWPRTASLQRIRPAVLLIARVRSARIPELRGGGRVGSINDAANYASPEPVVRIVCA